MHTHDVHIYTHAWAIQQDGSKSRLTQVALALERNVAQLQQVVLKQEGHFQTGPQLGEL